MNDVFLAELELTISKVRWSPEPVDGETQYVMFSRSGYTGGLEHVAATHSDVRRFDSSDVITTDTNS